MSVLVRGYYYSIRGDAYLQKMWNTIKSMLPHQAAGMNAFPPVFPQKRPRRPVKPARPAKTKKKFLQTPFPAEGRGGEGS
jgi:hypothetical protein